MRNFPLLVLALLASACGAPGQETAVAKACPNGTTAALGGPISLIDETGARVTQDTFKGRKSLVFFGYTYCPDICPLTMFKLGQALGQLPPDAPVPKTVFISVDPDRDTPEALTQYIHSNGFPKDVTGLTGTEEELLEAARAYGPTFSKEDPGDGSDGYLVSHNSLVFLMDEDWKLATYFRPDETPEAIATCVAALR
ncbi:MAG: SCO family protein [Hyphomonadaceae bacterium]